MSRATQKKRNSTGRVGTLWRNSRGRALTEERTPERGLMAGQVGVTQVSGGEHCRQRTASAKALGWECACMFGKQQGR